MHTYRSLAEFDQVFDGQQTGHVYYRFGHVNGTLPERRRRARGRAEAAVLGASGIAVLTATLLRTLKLGDTPSPTATPTAAP